MTHEHDPPFDWQPGAEGKPQAVISGGNLNKVSAVIGQAEKKAKLALAKGNRDFPKPGQAWGSIMPGTWKEEGAVDETGCIPENCPIRPLGYDGENYYFVDTSGQIFNTGTAAMGVERMQKLFAGCEDFLWWAWPAFPKGGKGAVTGFKAEHARRDLYAAAREKGPWILTDKVRGRGAWLDDDGNLIVHCGEFLWVDGNLHETGELGGYFYVRRPASFTPWERSVELDDNPAVELFEAFTTWNMMRGKTDALLLLGSMGVSLMGAAAGWKPSIFITGDAGSGKSELNGADGIIRKAMGRAMVATTNATEAGLYQYVGHDSLPIAIDEMENDENIEQTKKIIKMARDAASGSVRIRGGADHKGVEFQARSTFFFSGIVPPPMSPASLSRLAIIQLRPLEDGKVDPPELEARETVGPRLLRRMVDGFDGFEALLSDYMGVLRGGGHNARGQKTFGTFLAAAHMLLGDEGMHKIGFPAGTSEDDSLEVWAKELAADAVPELSTAGPDFKKCIEWLLSARPEVFRGGTRSSVAEILFDQEAEPGAIKKQLGAADLGLLTWTEFCRRVIKSETTPNDLAELPAGPVLCVPAEGQELAKLFAGSPYAGSWHWSLGSAPGGIVVNDKSINRVSIAGNQKRCMLVLMGQWKKWIEDNG